jgi:hypothetical protein
MKEILAISNLIQLVKTDLNTLFNYLNNQSI